MNKVIVHIPHSGIFIPKEYSDIFVVDEETLKKELLLMTDRYTDELFEHENSIVFPVSRLICDVERFRNEADEEMTEKGMWVCYEKTSDGKQLKICTDKHKNEILTQYYDVHHKKLTEAVETALEEYRDCIIVDAHSFSSTPLPHEPSQEIPRSDICIGTDDFHTPYKLLDYCKSFFELNGYSVAINNPFGGTIVPTAFCKKNPKVKSVMIEINRSLYMNEQTGEKSKKIEDVKQLISTFLADITNYENIKRVTADMFIMAEEPAEGVTPEMLREWLKNNQTEFDIATAISISHNKWLWFAFDCDEEDGEQFVLICDAWYEIFKELQTKALSVLENENLEGIANHDLTVEGTYYKLVPFMERNGFIDGNGWWIYDCEDD